MAAETVSLLRKLLSWVLLPMLFLWLLSAAGTYYLASRYANIAFDRSLADSARDLMLQVEAVDGVASLHLPPVAIQMFLSDQYDKIYFHVSERGRHIAGEPGLPMPEVAAAPGSPATMHSGFFEGKQVRIASLHFAVPGDRSGQSVVVQVAETLNKRKLLAREIVATMALPQLVLIVLAGLIVWLGIEKGLSPLERLRSEIASRSHRDLSPVEESAVPLEVRPLIEAINGLMKRLDDAMEAQRRFIADAAHQLRTPLSGLKTQTDLALRQANPQNLRHAFQQLSTSTDRAVHLVNQMLALAEVEPGVNRTPEMRPLDLNAMVRAVTMDWVPRALQKEIDMGYEGPDEEVTIEGDAFRIKMLIDNLLDNAVNYSPAGSRVTTKVETGDGLRVLLSVEDNGPGIPKEERNKVFQRFYRILGSPGDGSGLGLSIVQEIAAAHKASAELDEPAGHTGTIVRISFPRLLGAQRSS